jgi:hypothetical protein
MIENSVGHLLLNRTFAEVRLKFFHRRRRGRPLYETALKGEQWVRILAFEPSKVGYYDGEDIG